MAKVFPRIAMTKLSKTTRFIIKKNMRNHSPKIIRPSISLPYMSKATNAFLFHDPKAA